MAPKSPPWKRKRPATPRVKLSKEAIALAKARAKAAGRTYPNLVDNMFAAKWMKSQKR